MADQREAILVRLLAIARALRDGGYVNLVERNIPSLGERPSLPAIVLLDGDEDADEEDPRNRPSMAKRRMHMTPHLMIAVSARPEDTGTDLNALRALVINAVLSDSQLQALVLDRTGIRYEGMISPRDELGRMVLSQRHLRFTFTYQLDPAAL